MKDYLRAIENWDIPFLTQFLYETKKEIYQDFFDILHKRNKKEKHILFQMMMNSCIKLCEFCLFKKEKNCFISLEDFEIILGNLEKKGVRSILLSFGFILEEKLQSYLDTIKDFSIDYFIDLDFFFLEKAESFLLFSSYPIKAIFIDYIPCNMDLKNFFRSLKDFSSEAYFFQLKEISKKNDVYLNYYFDLPGQSFKDVIEDLKYYFQFNLKGIRFIPFLPDIESDWQFFDHACSFNLLKILGLIRYYKPDWEIFVDDNILKLSHKNILEEIFKKGADSYIYTLNSDLALSKDKDWILDKIRIQFEGLGFFLDYF